VPGQISNSNAGPTKTVRKESAMKTITGTRGYLVIGAGIAMMIGSAVLSFFALPIVVTGLRARQFDQSAQETASFLEQARAESILRNAPVACRLETHGTKAVLVLDWNLGSTKVHPEGRRLELPRGVVVSRAGQPQSDGTVAIFNPRGGVMLGSQPKSGKSGSARSGVVTAALDLSWPDALPNDLRKISMVGSGDFQVGSSAAENKSVQYAAASAMEAK
jgi:Tfp pilus assembly protein FimT